MSRLLTAAVFLIFSLILSASLSLASVADESAQLRAENALGNLPLRFEKNEGQASDEVKFLSRGLRHSIYFTSTEAVTVLSRAIDGSSTENPMDEPGDQKKSPKLESSVVRMEVVGANKKAVIKGEDKLPGTSNYFKGNDQSKWRQGVANYQKVHYEEVYPGIDLVYYGNQKKLEYDFVVKPGADPDKIELDFKGAEELSIDGKGNLIIKTKNGKVVQHAPIIYQNIDGKRQTVQGSYLLKDNHNIAFQLADYNPDHNLVIDPVVGFSTYLGGTGDETVLDMVVDDQGDIYLTGWTVSTDFDLLNEIEGVTGNTDVIVVKLEQTGNVPSLAFSTYLGGSDFDAGRGIAVDGEGNVYVTGSTHSPNFDLVNAIEGDSRGIDVFVFKLTQRSNIPSLAFSTYLGGSGDDVGMGIGLDKSANIYVAGHTDSPDFDVLNQIEGHNGLLDTFVFKLTQNGNVPSLAYSTYVGGTKGDFVVGMGVEPSGTVYVAGDTRSTDFNLVNELQEGLGGGQFGSFFVYKLEQARNVPSLGYSTTIRSFTMSLITPIGPGDSLQGIAIDLLGNVYLTGYLFHEVLPMVNNIGPTNTLNRFNSDVFVLKLGQTSGTPFIAYSTRLGGGLVDFSYDIAAEDSGSVFITGSAAIFGFPLVDELPEHALGGNYLLKLENNSNVPVVTFSSRLGFSNTSTSFAGVDTRVAVDNVGDAYVAGPTDSSTLNLLNEIEGFNGDDDIYLMKVVMADTTPPVITAPADFKKEATGPGTLVDPGTATATDDVSDPADIIITSSIVVPGLFPLGTTIITWTAEDEAGNQSTAEQKVTVADTTPPTIEILGANPFFLEVGTPFVDPWAVAGDLVDGPIALSAISEPGDSPEQIKVTYSATDSSGNTATAVRIVVIVADLTPPIITILGDNPAFIEAGDPYVDAGATAIDAQDGVLPVTTTSTEVSPGEFAIVYTATDSSGNSESAVRTLFVVADLTPPVITIHGFNPITAEVGEPYVDLGATAVDNVDGLLPITTTTELGDIEGTFDVIYTATDSSGNSSTATRHVIPTDTTPPVITILGDNPQTVQQGDPYVDPGATATDNADGPPIPVTSTIQPGAAPGTFEVVYSASDSSGNNATAIRVVQVLPEPQ